MVKQQYSFTDFFAYLRSARGPHFFLLFFFFVFPFFFFFFLLLLFSSTSPLPPLPSPCFAFVDSFIACQPFFALYKTIRRFFFFVCVYMRAVLFCSPCESTEAPFLSFRNGRARKGLSRERQLRRKTAYVRLCSHRASAVAILSSKESFFFGTVFDHGPHWRELCFFFLLALLFCWQSPLVGLLLSNEVQVSYCFYLKKKK